MNEHECSDANCAQRLAAFADAHTRIFGRDVGAILDARIPHPSEVEYFHVKG